MAYLYELEIQSFPNGDDCERYGIGIFRTRAEAEDTAQRYLSEVKGFRDYYCEYTVQETELIGDGDPLIVHTFFGWNLDDDENETDIISGSVYTDTKAAEAAMETEKRAHARQEWALRHWKLGKCEFAEGYDRDYPSGRIAPTLAELREGLRALTEPRTMCGIEFEYSDNLVYGFPLIVAEQLFLMAEDDDFILDGFIIRRLRDIYELGYRKGIYQHIAEQEGLTSFDLPDVNISDWANAFNSLKKLGKHVIVEREYGEGFFYIGTIETVADDHVLLCHYDADGIWQEEPVAIQYRDITSVSFGTRYAETFSKYV